MKFPADKRPTTFAKFSDVARSQVTFFPAPAARNAAKKLVTALALDIENANVYAAAVSAAVSDPAIAAPSSPLFELCNSLRTFVSPPLEVMHVASSPFAVKIFRDAVTVFVHSLTSGAAVPAAHNTGLFALSLQTWGTHGISPEDESRERALLLGMYPQLSMLMTSITCLPAFLLPIVNRLREIEATVATAVTERHPDWLPHDVHWQNVSAEDDRQYGYICPPSMRWQSSKLIVFTANGLAPASMPRVPLAAIKKSKPKGSKNDGAEDLIHCEEDSSLLGDSHDMASHSSGSSSHLMVVSCTHGNILAMRLSPSHESLHTITDLLMRLRKSPLREAGKYPLLLIDVACLLFGYVITRFPGLIMSFVCRIDRMHSLNHVWCGMGFKIGSYFSAREKTTNSSSSEQVNSQLQKKLSTILGYSTGANAVALLELYIDSHNEKKNAFLRSVAVAPSAAV